MGNDSYCWTEIQQYDSVTGGKNQMNMLVIE